MLDHLLTFDPAGADHAPLQSVGHVGIRLADVAEAIGQRLDGHAAVFTFDGHIVQNDFSGCRQGYVAGQFRFADAMPAGKDFGRLAAQLHDEPDPGIALRETPTDLKVRGDIPGHLRCKLRVVDRDVDAAHGRCGLIVISSRRPFGRFGRRSRQCVAAVQAFPASRGASR